MASVFLNFETDDYDAWKPMFDQDPAGRRDSGATRHMIARAADNPNDVFVAVEFPTVDQAKAFRQRLAQSGALDRPGTKVKTGPIVAEEAETFTY
jgi:hypothetical protein